MDFVSVSKRDRLGDYEERRVEYVDLGVAEYWVIDRFRHTLSVVKDADTEQKPQIFDRAALFRTPRLPGFESPIARLFGVTDSWKKPG